MILAPSRTGKSWEGQTLGGGEVSLAVLGR